MEVRAFELQYRTLYRPLGMYALRITGDIDSAEDVVQESFAQVWESLNRGTEISDLRRYMYTTVRNNALMAMRGNIDKVSFDESYSDLPLEEAIDTSERDSRLWGVIDKLPDQCRNVFLMSKRDGMTYAQIAEELNLSVRTVEHHISKALERLRDAVKGAALLHIFLDFLLKIFQFTIGVFRQMCIMYSKTQQLSLFYAGK